MPGFSFYAARQDLCAVFRYIFEEWNVHIFEHLSAYDSPLREFKGIEDIHSLPDLGKAEPFSYFEIWSPDVISGVSVRKMDLDPATCGGHTYRYRLEGGGLIQLFCGGITGDEPQAIVPTRFQYLTPGEAKKWGVEDGVHWSRLRAYSGKLLRQVAARMAVATVNDLAILPEAMDLIQTGYRIKESLRSAVTIPPSAVPYQNKKK